MTMNPAKVDDAELSKLGIRRVERHVYQWGEYIYSNLGDAVAAARRQVKS